MSDLLTFNNDIMDIIVNNIDTESLLIVGLTWISYQNHFT